MLKPISSIGNLYFLIIFEKHRKKGLCGLSAKPFYIDIRTICRSTYLIKRLFQIGDKVIGIFESNRITDQIR